MAYQLILLHDEQGAGYDAPVYDMGVMSYNEAVQVAAHIGSAASVCGVTEHAGLVSNILQAWASPEYRVWFIPEDMRLPCLEYINEELVETKEDPR